MRKLLGNSLIDIWSSKLRNKAPRGKMLCGRWPVDKVDISRKWTWTAVVNGRDRRVGLAGVDRGEWTRTRWAGMADNVVPALAPLAPRP